MTAACRMTDVNSVTMRCTFLILMHEMYEGDANRVGGVIE